MKDARHCSAFSLKQRMGMRLVETECEMLSVVGYGEVAVMSRYDDMVSVVGEHSCAEVPS